MSSDDGSRRRRQAFQGAVSPAGVGTSVSNQVSPDTLQLSTYPIDQAFANMGIADMRAYLDALPPPNSLLAPTGIGSRASNSPVSSGARTPASHISVPSAGGSRDATGVGSVNRNNEVEVGFKVEVAAVLLVQEYQEPGEVVQDEVMDHA